nr:phosphate ABC transporter permease subunit PstC [Clostridium oryzae]
MTKIKNEYAGRIFSTLCGFFIIILTITIIFFITSRGIQTFTKHGYPLSDFLFSGNWKASENKFGTFNFILGSGVVSLGAVIVSTPLAICLAVFMNLISPRLGRKFLQPAMELFVGIPSVVYGWIGITVLIPFIKRSFGGLGFSMLAGIIVLSIMILPTITSISSDTIKTIPQDYLEASYGLGATRWQTIVKVIIPSAKSGISTGVVLGMARAFGEALAVQMVIGNARIIPKNLLQPGSTLTSAITMDMANTTTGSAWNAALWSMGLILLIVSFIFIVITRIISRRGDLH